MNRLRWEVKEKSVFWVTSWAVVYASMLQLIIWQSTTGPSLTSFWISMIMKQALYNSNHVVSWAMVLVRVCTLHDWVSLV